MEFLDKEYAQRHEDQLLFITDKYRRLYGNREISTTITKKTEKSKELVK
jgi:hypothetical protein